MSIFQHRSEFPNIILEKDPDPLPGLPLTADIIFNKSNTVYGGSGQGKTTLVKYLMYLLKDKIGAALVFCPSAKASNTDYDKCIPRALIHTDIDKKIFIKLAHLQEAKATQYKYVQDKNTILSLYNKVRSKEIDIQIHRRNRVYQKVMGIIHSQQMKEDLDENVLDELKKDLERIKNMLTDMEYETYRCHISANQRKYNVSKLSKNEKVALMYIDLNPYILVVFDDCTEELKSICRRAEKDPECGEFWKFYTQGRHKCITIITISHDVSSIAKGIRSNSFNNFFADKMVASAFFTQQNSIDGPLVKRMRSAIPIVYGNTKLHKYNKICYCKNNPIQIFYTHTPNPTLYEDSFIMCKKSVRKLLEKRTKKDEIKISDNNEFKDKF